MALAIPSDMTNNKNNRTALALALLRLRRAVKVERTLGKLDVDVANFEACMARYERACDDVHNARCAVQAAREVL